MKTIFSVMTFFVLCLAWLAISNSAPAGVVTIGSLDMFPKPNVTDGVQGITFDGSPNPLVLDSWRGDQSRLFNGCVNAANTSDEPRAFHL